MKLSRRSGPIIFTAFDDHFAAKSKSPVSASSGGKRIEDRWVFVIRQLARLCRQFDGTFSVAERIVR
jgi:hypothetical protein